MDGTGYETATKAVLAADGERHHWLQSAPCMRRAQPISCKCATSARNRPKIAVIQRPRGLHTAILVTSHTHTHTQLRLLHSASQTPHTHTHTSQSERIVNTQTHAHTGNTTYNHHHIKQPPHKTCNLYVCIYNWVN